MPHLNKQAKFLRKNVSSPAFIPGLDLSEGYFFDEIQPLITMYLPELPYSAALIGGSSEVLGFDTEMSTDHDWGPRVMIFLHEEDFVKKETAMRNVAMKHLPQKYKNYQIRFFAQGVKSPATRHRLNPGDPGLEPMIDIYTLRSFLDKHMGIDIDRPMSVSDWLSTTHHRLRALVSGRVYRDDIGLQAVRDRFAWYPHNIWLYILASCWNRIGEAEVLTGRAGSVDDNLGSKIIAMRLVRDIMRLGFLMERVYPPYSKWFGSAFRELKCAPTLLPLLCEVAQAADWKKRDKLLAKTYRILVTMHNALRLTVAVPDTPKRFWERPFTIIGGGSIAVSLANEIKDSSVKSLANRWLIGNVDLFNDNHVLDDDPSQRHLLKTLYE
jgi:hypothetical protein